jgi:predicted acetyltransferase
MNISLELQNQIVYGMENQSQSFFLDIQSMELVSNQNYSMKELKSDERYVPIPHWKPIDGFQLMEQFVSQLKNPVIRKNLLVILNSGKGVFKGFKQILKEHPEVERKWFSFKESKMRSRIKSWFAELTQLKNLELIYDEELDEDNSDLLFEEFRFSRSVAKQDAELKDLDRLAITSIFSDELGGSDYWNTHYRQSLGELDSNDKNQFIAVVSSSEDAILGFVWLHKIQNTEQWAIHQMFVIDSHRDLGLGLALLEYVKKQLYPIQLFVWLVPGDPEGWAKITKKAGELEKSSTGIYFLICDKTLRDN